MPWRHRGRFLEIVQVEPSRLDAFHDGMVLADGTEQIILEYDEVARIMGYVDLGNMWDGDVVVICQYLRVRPRGEFRKYAEEKYEHAQKIPVLYLKPKESDYGVKVTLQQTAGFLKSFDYNFIRER